MVEPTPTLISDDIPYQATLGVNATGLTFDPASPGVLYVNGNRSVWTTTLSGAITTSTVPSWTDQGIGLEQLVANEIIVAGNGQPLAASWDTAVVDPNQSTYVSTIGPVNSGSVVAGWSIDYDSSDRDFIVLLSDGGYAGGPQESSYSTNDGQTWTAFPTIPPGGSFGGNIAASTPTNWVFASAGESNLTIRSMAATPGTRLLFPGVSSWSNFIGAFFADNQVITADRVLSNTFYLLYSGIGVFKTTNGGANWTLVSSSAMASRRPAHFQLPAKRAISGLFSGASRQCR